MAKFTITVEDVPGGVRVSVDTQDEPVHDGKNDVLQVTYLLYKALQFQVEHIKRMVDGLTNISFHQHKNGVLTNGTDTGGREAQASNRDGQDDVHPTVGSKRSRKNNSGNDRAGKKATRTVR